MKPTVLLAGVLVSSAFPGLVSGGASETTTPISPYKDGELISINSTAAPDYQRILGPDGKPRSETFAFGEGGLIDRANANDLSLHKISFGGIVTQLAPVLAGQGYVSGAAPAETSLMIMVYWGMTGLSPSLDIKPPPPDPLIGGGFAIYDMVTRLRDVDTRDNARIIGYTEAIRTTRERRPDFVYATSDLAGEVEDARFFVVLIAYDFQKLLKEKKTEVRWVTRFSLRAYHRMFDKSLPEMLVQAAPFFGRDSGGLQRNIKTEVKMGELQILGDQKGEPEAEVRDK